MKRNENGYCNKNAELTETAKFRTEKLVPVVFHYLAQKRENRKVGPKSILKNPKNPGYTTRK
jgi:hypothetical protein